MKHLKHRKTIFGKHLNKNMSMPESERKFDRASAHVHENASNPQITCYKVLWSNTKCKTREKVGSIHRFPCLLARQLRVHQQEQQVAVVPNSSSPTRRPQFVVPKSSFPSSPIRPKFPKSQILQHLPKIPKSQIPSKSIVFVFGCCCISSCCC